MVKNLNLYERAIAHPKIRNEFLIVKWSKGFKTTEVWYRDRLVKIIHGINALKQKVFINDEELGVVEIYLEENPFIINLKIDGIHSIENVKHPSKRIKRIGSWNILGLLFHSLGVAIMVNDIFFQRYHAKGDSLILLYHSFFFLCFLVSFIFVRLNYPKYFYLGLIGYYVQAVCIPYLILTAPSNANFQSMWILTSIYFVFCILLIVPIKRLRIYLKHKPFDFDQSQKILDD